MLEFIKNPLYKLLRWSEKYTKTDMVHFASSNFWLTGGRVAALGSGIVLTIAFANLLSPELFGTYKYVLAGFGLMTAFSLTGLSASIMRVSAQGRQSAIPGLVRRSMVWSLPASAIALGVAGYYFVHANYVLGWGFAFIAVFSILNNGYGLSKFIFAGIGDFKKSTITGLPRTLFPIVVIVATLLITHNIIYILLAYFASNALASWVLYRWLIKHYHIPDSPEHVPTAMRFGIHMSIIGFFQLANGQLDSLLLWHFADPATLAVFALAMSPIQQVMSFMNNFFSIAFPKLAVKTKEEVYRALPLRLTQMFIVSLVAAGGYIALAPIVFTALFPKYHASILASQVLACIIILQPKGFIDALFVAHGEVKKRYKLIIVTQIADLLLTVGLIPVFGLWGAVAAAILSEAASAITLWIMYRQR